jgi:hypothetical protein
MRSEVFTVVNDETDRVGRDAVCSGRWLPRGT